MSYKDIFGDTTESVVENTQRNMNNSDSETLYEDVDVINLTDICQTFKTPTGEFKLFDHFNLDIKDFKGEGQFITFMGQSGCGKTQLCKLIAGLTTCDSGSIKVYGKPLQKNQSYPMVFQQYSSYPWMTVIKNVMLPMLLKGVDEETAKKKAQHLLDIVGLGNQSDKWAQYPTLSGGQLQRVSLARNLAANSQIMFLDEATSALDIKSKRDMQDTLLDIYYNAELDPTFINISHDISEAVYLSNRIYIFKANPCQIYKVIDIDLGVDRRTQDVRSTERYTEYVREIESIMKDCI